MVLSNPELTGCFPTCHSHMDVIGGFPIVIAEHNAVESSIKAFGAMDEELRMVLAFGDALPSPCGNPILLPHHSWWRGALPETKFVKSRTCNLSQLCFPWFFHLPLPLSALSYVESSCYSWQRWAKQVEGWSHSCWAAYSNCCLKGIEWIVIWQLWNCKEEGEFWECGRGKKGICPDFPVTIRNSRTIYSEYQKALRTTKNNNAQSSLENLNESPASMLLLMAVLDPTNKAPWHGFGREEEITGLIKPRLVWHPNQHYFALLWLL